MSLLDILGSFQSNISVFGRIKKKIIILVAPLFIIIGINIF